MVVITREQEEMGRMERAVDTSDEGEIECEVGSSARELVEKQ